MIISSDATCQDPVKCHYRPADSQRPVKLPLHFFGTFLQMYLSKFLFVESLAWISSILNVFLFRMQVEIVD